VILPPGMAAPLGMACGGMRDLICGVVVQTMLKAGSRIIVSAGSPRLMDLLPASLAQ